MTSQDDKNKDGREAKSSMFLVMQDMVEAYLLKFGLFPTATIAAGAILSDSKLLDRCYLIQTGQVQHELMTEEEKFVPTLILGPDDLIHPEFRVYDQSNKNRYMALSDVKVCLVGTAQLELTEPTMEELPELVRITILSMRLRALEKAMARTAIKAKLALAQNRRDSSRLKTQIQQTETALLALQFVRGEIDQELNKLKEKLAASEAKNAELEAENADLRRRLAEAQRANSSLKNQVLQEGAIMEQQGEELEALKDQNESLTQGLDESKRELAALRRENGRLKGTRKSLTEIEQNQPDDDDERLPPPGGIEARLRAELDLEVDA